MILPPRYLAGAEGCQMVGDELGVKQAVATGLEPRHQMYQSDLRCVARAVEHALAEEHRAERHAIKTADQLIAIIDLDAMAMPVLVQPAIQRPDALIDPGAGAAGNRFGAARDHRVE